jgi:hypothetical protein
MCGRALASERPSGRRSIESGHQDRRILLLEPKSRTAEDPHGFPFCLLESFEPFQRY